VHYSSAPAAQSLASTGRCGKNEKNGVITSRWFAGEAVGVDPLLEVVADLDPQPHPPAPPPSGRKQTRQPVVLSLLADTFALFANNLDGVFLDVQYGSIRRQRRHDDDVAGCGLPAASAINPVLALRAVGVDNLGRNRDRERELRQVERRRAPAAAGKSSAERQSQSRA